MKAVARLIMMYIIAFLFFIIAGTVVAVMREYLEATRTLQAHVLPLAGTALRGLSGSLPAAFYMSALMVLPSAMKTGLGAFVTGIIVLIMGCLSLFGVASGVLRLSDTVDPRFFTASIEPHGEAGLVIRTGEASVCLLTGPKAGSEGKAIYAVPTKSLRIANAAEALGPTPPTLFASSLVVPPTLISLSRDFAASATRLSQAAQSGVLPLLAYTGALALLLAAFSPLTGATRWPFADLVLCAVCFRAALAFESVAASGLVQRLVAEIAPTIPSPYIPAVTIGAAALFAATMGTFLIIARGKGAADE